jgi:flagellar biosynthesis regulator FlaF
MNGQIADIGIAPNSTQIKRGLECSRKAMQMIEAAKNGRNESKLFINALLSRHRGLIYFMADITKERHRLKFEQLAERERLAVIEAMRDLKELAASMPRRLLSSDSVIKDDV